MKSKLYPPAKWGEIFRGLQPEAADKKILLAGSEDQRASLEEVLAALRKNGCARAEIVFPADLVEFVNLIAGAEMVLTVDTAAAHFATAQERTAVVVVARDRGGREEKKLACRHRAGTGGGGDSRAAGIAPGTCSR